MSPDETITVEEPLVPRRWWNRLHQEVEDELRTYSLGTALERERDLHCRWVLSLMRKIENSS